MDNHLSAGPKTDEIRRLLDDLDRKQIEAQRLLDDEHFDRIQREAIKRVETDGGDPVALTLAVVREHLHDIRLDWLKGGN